MIFMSERVDVTIEKEIDARGSFSPDPLMELLRELRGMPVGSGLAVLSSDPGSIRVIPPGFARSGMNCSVL
jgi:TusA-related sulfurtransferase